MKFGNALIILVVNSFILCSCKINDSTNTIYNYEYILMSTDGCFGKCALLDYKISSDSILFNLNRGFENKGLYYLRINQKEIIRINDYANEIINSNLEKEYFDKTQDAQVINFILKRKENTTNIIYYGHIEPKSLEQLNEFVFRLLETKKDSLLNIDYKVDFESKARFLEEEKKFQKFLDSIGPLPDNPRSR